MRTVLFIIISLVAGIMAGEVLTVINLFVVEPTTDQAIGFEIQKDIANGEKVDLGQINSYRIWQKSGTFLAGALIGMAYGALLGVAFVFARKYLPTSDDRKKAILLAVLMYLALYLVPFSKYPANPPSVGNPDTITFRQHLYTTYQITSVAIAIVMGVLFFKYRNIDKMKYIIPTVYVLLISSIYFLWPPNPDKIELSMSVVNTFRAITGITMAVFFTFIGIFLGLLWNKFKPHEATKINAI